MKEILKIAYSLDEIPAIASQLKELLKKSAVMTFTGPLGAGKTTMVKELLRQMGVQDLITSPTFAYLNQYADQQGGIYYHFDLYRLDTLDAFLAAGFDEYLFVPGSKALIEWPAPIMPLLEKQSYHVTIDYHQDPGKRVIFISEV